MKHLGYAAALVVIGSFLAECAQAELPRFASFELQVRTGFKDDTYRIPSGAFISGSTPDISDNGTVAIKVLLPGDNMKGLWLGRGDGQMIDAATFQGVMGDASLNDQDKVIWTQHDSDADGVHGYNPESGKTGLVVGIPAGTAALPAFVNNRNQIGYRARNNQSFVLESFDPGPPAPSIARHAVDAATDPNSPYAYLFTPSFNDHRQIAAVVRRGAAGDNESGRPDEIRVFNADGSGYLIAADTDADPTSRYAKFDNSVSLNNAGRVAFIAELKETGKRTVVISSGQVEHSIATEGEGEVTKIEYFHAAANEGGLVAFRGVDQDKKQTLFIGDGRQLHPLLRAGDPIETDKGQGKVKGFSGSPAINNKGEVAFAIELEGGGMAVYVARVPNAPTAPGGGGLSRAD